jgi:hypothetical protein
VNDTPVIMHEEQENATVEQGKLMNHTAMGEDPGDASVPDRTGGECRNGCPSQDADTVSSWSSLSTPPESNDEQDRTSDDPGSEPKSLAASTGSATLDGVPSRPSWSAAAKARQKSASPRGVVHRPIKKSPEQDSCEERGAGSLYCSRAG